MDKELLECAKINFDNLELAVPIILQHPYYVIAKGQLNEALGYESLEDRLAKQTQSKNWLRRRWDEW